ncbi:MAG TPA: RdgB/HAM1 family non-canonical purine NTP pyrophosphatase [Devosia sp.]|nr:RdgB/HAM1 family non-canonical purine NTP pyrophosphatase [Devosia sp.]
MTDRSRNLPDLPAVLRLNKGDRLLVATHNAGKLAEFRQLFAPFGLDLVSAAELGLPEPEENGTSFAENAFLKAHAAAQGADLLSLADDSGLCVDALDGRPGIYTARWTGPDRDFSFGMQRVEDALQKAGARAPDQRRAAFVATLCLATPDGTHALFEGRAQGTLVWPPRGERGFGFDPMFQPDGHTRTFGEMDSALKHSWTPQKTGLSHRARAFARLVEVACEL